MCPDFRRGADAVAQAQQKAKSGGSFSPFAPELFWQNDGDEKYLLFLNPMMEVPTVEMISFIPQVRKKADGEKFTTYERVIARTDPSIGDDEDPMHEDWQGRIQDLCVAVAVELEPTLEEVRGRMRPTGFQIKTNTYERRVRDDDGDLTEEVEEITSPVIGFIHASPHNFFNVITAYDSTEGDIESTPLKITRVGTGTSTAFQVVGYPDQEIDLAPLLDEIEGVSYLSEEEMTDLVAAIDGIEDASEAALLIGSALLDKRLEELIDQERYDKLYKSITETLDKWGGKNKGKGKKAEKSTSKRERPARRSSRRTTEEPEAKDEAPAEEKPARKRRAPAAKAADAEEQVTPQQNPEAMGKLEKLRQRNADAKAKSAQ